MNILFVASDNNYTSGAFLSMVKLNQILREKFNINTYVVLPNEGDGNPLLDEIGADYEIVPSRNWIVDIEEGKTQEREKEKEAELSGNEAAIERICTLIREKDIDIVHINTSYSYVGAVAAKREGVPFVWHIREFLEEDQHRKIWNREKGYALMGEAAAIVAISDKIAEKYGRIFNKEKLYTIYNGIDDSLFYQQKDKIFKQEKAAFSIVGGIVPHKGQEELVRACGLLKKRGWQNFTLRIIGKGRAEYVDKLMNLITEYGLEDNIVFPGASNAIPAALERTDVLFVCSRNEAFGRVTVEGMMSGCLVIGADTAGTTELITDGVSGYLYRQGDAEALADKIEYALKNPAEAEKLRLRGQEEALNKYTADKNAEAVKNLYLKLKGYTGENG